jgi:hypothetical protein
MAETDFSGHSMRGEPSLRTGGKEAMEDAPRRSESEKATSQDNFFDSSKKRRLSLVMEALRLENFPFVVLLLLSTISLVSRIWLMLR